jgi:hypothetical protein
MRTKLIAMAVVLAIFALAVVIASDESGQDAQDTSFTFEDAKADGHMTRAEWAVAAGLRDEQIAIVCDLSHAEAKGARSLSLAELQPICGDSSVPSSNCPEANAALESAGFPVPDDYAPACPTPKHVRRLIESTVETPPAALREALEEGVIHEGQDPKTYPPEVKQAISQ